MKPFSVNYIMSDKAKRFLSIAIFVGLVFIYAVPVSFAEDLYIDTSSFMNVNDNDMKAESIIIKGTLSATQDSLIRLTGNWTNEGAFNPGNSTVSFEGVNQTISGGTSFFNLTKIATSPATMTIAQNTTIEVLPGGKMILRGLPGLAANKLKLNSSNPGPGNYWYLKADGTHEVAYVIPSDSNAGPGLTIYPVNSKNGGDTVNWHWTNPKILLTAYLNGFYKSVSGTQTPTTIEAQLREGLSPDTATSIITSKEALLATTGTQEVVFDNDDISVGDYYIAVYHKIGGIKGANHLSVISSAKHFVTDAYAAPVDITTLDAVYTTSSNPSMFPETSSKYSLWGGDINADSNINLTDYYALLPNFGYTVPTANTTSDLNGDGVVNLTDYFILSAGFGRQSRVP